MLGAVATVAVVAVHWDSSPAGALALGALMVVATVLAAIDLAVHRLPNVIVGPLALAVTFAIVAAGLVDGDTGRILFALGAGFAFALLFLIGNLLADIGMGDVKYAYPVFATAAWFGVLPLQVTLMGMALSAAVVAVWVLARHGGKGTAMAYGPYMSLGLALGLVVAGVS